MSKYFFVIFATLFLIGCKKSELEPLQIYYRIQSDDLIGAFYTTNGETIRFSLVVDKEKSTAGLTMKQIEVFISNIKIAEVFNKESIDIQHELKNKTIGKNPMRITLKASAPNYRDTNVHLNLNVNVTDKKPIYGFDLVANEVWNNGEETTISIKDIINATMILTVNSVSYLVDDSIIASTTEKASVISYKVQDLSPGNHILYALIDCTTPDGQLNTIISKSKQIKVQ